ncbi:uncharacterized protein [Prorops nasuta]|uniref:uncharacterized protein n=1 Tax=Prorops nasuta TaxID=863751 RepID=UPI0034CD5049
MSKLNIPSKANVKKNLDSCKYASNRNIDVKSISDDTDSESTDKTGFVKSPLKRKNNMLPKNVNNSEATSYNDTADDNADDTTKDKELKDALKKIVRIEIRKSTMQLQIDLNNHFKVLNDNLSMNLNLNRGIDKDSIFNCTGVKLPIQSLDDFKMFDEKLTTEEEFLKNILKPFLVDKATTSSNFKDAIHKILKSLMTTDLQKLYTACGRTSAFGTKKLRFIDTNVYKCMTEVLLSVFSGQASSEAIQSNTSRWLSGAMDRDNEEKIDTMRMLKICYVFLVCVLLIVIILSF